MGSPYLKSEWYSNFVGNLTERNLFTMIDPYQHGQHRKLTAYNFSERHVKTMEPYIARNTQLAVNRMQDEERSKGYCDVFKWFMFMVC